MLIKNESLSSSKQKRIFSYQFFQQGTIPRYINKVVFTAESLVKNKNGDQNIYSQIMISYETQYQFDCIHSF
jgi:hypothetical protein